MQLELSNTQKNLETTKMAKVDQDLQSKQLIEANSKIESLTQ